MAVAPLTAMTKMWPPSSSRPLPVSARRLLHWTLASGDHSLACDVVLNGAKAFDVRVIPAWQPAATIHRTFTSTIAALECHAAVTRLLREDGWRVIARGADPRPQAA